MSDNYHFKLLTLGESNVGKTCILRRYVDDSFNKIHLSTIGIDFKTKTFTIGKKEIQLQIWDTAGQERFRTLNGKYFKDTDGILLVFDVTDSSSFEKISYWMDQISQHTGFDKISIVLLGNKVDIKSRVVTTEMAKELAEKYNVEYYETSAFTGVNIKECIEHLTTLIMKKHEISICYDNNDENRKSKLEKPNDNNQNKKCCSN